jgi:hypothetical protein
VEVQAPGAGGIWSKLNERTRNVFENKGPLWKNQARSVNVFENKRLILIIRECS